MAKCEGVPHTETSCKIWEGDFVFIFVWLQELKEILIETLVYHQANGTQTSVLIHKKIKAVEIVVLESH
jgi:hypothetical protein